MSKKIVVLAGKTLLSIGLLFAGVIVSSMLLQLLPEGGETVNNLATPMGLGLSAWLMYVCSERKQGWPVGWHDRRGAGHFLTGGILAAIVVALSAALMLGTRTVEVGQQDWAWIAVLSQVLLFLAVATGEEWLFRGYLFGLYRKAAGVRTAILVNSLLFTAIHLINPDSLSRPIEHVMLEMINIFLLAILISQARVFTGSLWMPIGLHFMLNLFQSTLFGFLNGGKEVKSIFRVSYDRLDIWNGASYGLEPSMIYTPVLLIAVGVYGWIGRKSWEMR